MIQNKSRRFRAVSFIDEQLHSGVATLQPQPPPQRSSVPDRRGGGNIGQPLQSDHVPVINHRGPNPPPSRIPFRSSTVPDDTWNRAWTQSVQRHTGVVLPPLAPQEKPRMAPQVTWQKHHFQYQDGRYVRSPPSVQQYIADKRKRTRQDFTDFHENERREKEIEERIRRMRRESEEEKRMETHLRLRASMESLSISILETEAESQSVVNAICEKDKDLRTLRGKTNKLEIEMERLERKSKRIYMQTAFFLRYVPPELWETFLKNLTDTRSNHNGLVLATDPHYSADTRKDFAQMFLLRSIKEKVDSLAELQKEICQGITSRLETLERQKLEMRNISRQKMKDNELLEKITFRLESQRDSYAAVQKRDMELVKIIAASAEKANEYS